MYLFVVLERSHIITSVVITTFINKTVKHNNLLNPIMGCLYVNFVGLHVLVIHMTIIRSVRAKEIAMQQRSPLL